MEFENEETRFNIGDKVRWTPGIVRMAVSERARSALKGETCTVVNIKEGTPFPLFGEPQTIDGKTITPIKKWLGGNIVTVVNQEGHKISVAQSWLEKA